MQLRGFDSYEVTLGDLMRGERASMGKSLVEAERDMRIKANLIDAIENCDLAAFKNHGVISGYVRSYARYLGMDSDHAFKRFCEESGFRTPTLDLAAPSDSGRGSRKGGGQTGAVAGTLAHALTQSRFAVPPAPSRLSTAVSLSGLASTAVLLALVAGLGYGGYALLQEIQRVGFAPLPEAPAVIAEAPVIEAPEAGPRRPDPSVYQGDGALAALALPSDLPLPAVPSRDGPISAIDPETAGIYAPPPEPQLHLRTVRDPIAARMADIERGAAIAAEAEAVPASGPPEVVVFARAEAWIRVRDGANAILFEGILRPGTIYAVPASAVAPTLRAGNAGDVFVSIGGEARGPVGAPGSVARAVSLAVEDVRAAWPAADGVEGAPASEPTVRAEVIPGN